MSKARRALGAAVLAAALSGCTTNAGGQPAPITTPPPVPHALVLAGHTNQTCGLLEPQDFAAMAVVIAPGSGYPNDAGNDPADTSAVCFATDETRTASLSLSLHPEENLLVTQYRKLGSSPDFTLDTALIDGYPAVYTNSPATAGRPNYGCEVMVATANDQSIQLRYTNLTDPDRAQWRAQLTTVAAAVLHRLGA